MPRVIPSAMPRYSENVPRVTMSGGSPRPPIRIPFRSPQLHPASKVRTIAIGKGTWASRQSTPNTTEHNASIDPTDKSMPPVMMMGVSASESSPSSTLSRTTSNRFASVKKCSAAKAKIRHSHANTIRSTHSPFGNKRRESGDSSSGTGAGEVEVDMLVDSADSRIGKDGCQDDCSLNRLFPERIYASEHQCRSDASQQSCSCA